MGRFPKILTITTAALTISACGGEGRFECPTPQAGGAGVLQESEQQTKSLSQLLASGDVENRIGLFVTDLRRRHPEAKDSALVNYLVTAYCPVVAAQRISDQEKKEKLDKFSSQALQIINR